ncbi:unnamed protein product [Rotaria sp. Silwood1]|nr:unnamed protein product [Rotaria sp. Silwood1]CAF0844756.1 unnamed protein product [Rotaria sp. Silwood1]CAF3401872.1 unnamed protein product [Rotaria sp. Silwood1]CAF4656968.1 unnamed protein product [Rotaria sp. Silwood1]
MVENLSSQLPTLDKYIGRIKRQQTEDKDCLKWDIEKGLPHLPVPNLDATLTKYLRCLEPIQLGDEFDRTKILVDQFRSPNANIGQRLQDMLIEHATKSENYVVDWWLEDMYLANPLPLPINSNPAFVLPQQNFQDTEDYLKFIAKLISGILDYKVLIDARALPIDRATSREKGQPLCMEQYYRLFSCYRMPDINIDRLIQIRNSKVIYHQGEHVIVAYRNQFFVLNVVINFTRLDEDDIYILLRRIVEIADHDPWAADEVGIYTSLSRRAWANVRAELVKDALNRDSLDLIERCIFIVCLDQSEANDLDENDDFVNFNNAVKRDFVSLGEQILHGGKTMFNASNRWYDKTMQFIIGTDGLFGLNYEHSPAEAIAVIQLIEHLFKYMEEKSQERFHRSKSLCELPVPHRLKWNLNNFLRHNISLSKERLKNAIDDFDLYILQFTGYGKDFPKQHNMSPDAFIQMCLQFTYFKMYNKLVSTYESASTRRFHFGRVDNIRANTPEALEWARAMVDESGNISAAEKLRLFRQAMQAQTDLMVQNILGNGMDCHMLALKQIARDNNLPMPDLFLDPGYALSNHFNLSTSQVTTNINDSFICYGAVVPDGYGCSYNVRSDSILFCISSFHSCSTTNSQEFAESLTDTLYEIRDLCTLVQRQQQTIALRRPSYAAKLAAQKFISSTSIESNEHNVT